MLKISQLPIQEDQLYSDVQAFSCDLSEAVHSHACSSLQETLFLLAKEAGYA